MSKQVQTYASLRSAKNKSKVNSRKQKLDEVIAIVSEMNEAKLDALILILDPPVDDGFELSEQDKLNIDERTRRYESGEDNGISAEIVIRQLREALKKGNKKLKKQKT